MTTSYRGMYRLDANGKPAHIQVASPGGHFLPLPIEQYELRGVLPDWRELPTEKQHKALSVVHQATQMKSPVLNRAAAEECADRDWLEPVGADGWRLTDAGREFL